MTLHCQTSYSDFYVCGEKKKSCNFDVLQQSIEMDGREGVC